jgi:hypothetical protein
LHSTDEQADDLREVIRLEFQQDEEQPDHDRHGHVDNALQTLLGPRRTRGILHDQTTRP